MRDTIKTILSSWFGIRPVDLDTWDTTDWVFEPETDWVFEPDSELDDWDEDNPWVVMTTQWLTGDRSNYIPVDRSNYIPVDMGAGASVDDLIDNIDDILTGYRKERQG